jgi:hypothetical protein
MTVKTNTLRVRRIDLLEQLEERYVFMTKEKERYDKEMTLYQEACDKYEADVERWEAKIEPFLRAELKKQEPVFVHHNRDYRYRSSYEYYSMSSEIRYTLEELQDLIGKYPERPEGPSIPDFLREGRGYKYDRPSLYQCVYQAIQLLSLSDDEHVNASTYQMALEVL